MYSRDFSKVSQNIIAFAHSQKVLLVFDSDIQVVDANIKNTGYVELKEYEIKLNKISDAKLNQSEKLMGVASIRGSTPEVILYEVNDGFAAVNKFSGFKASIKYVDFSTDSSFILCEDNLGEVSLF